MNDNNRVRSLILENLIYFQQQYEDVYPSQTLLGIKSGVTRESANRAIKIMQQKGWITTHHPYNSTLRYYLHPSIFQYKDLLKYKFPLLRKALSYFMLLSAISNASVTPSITKNYIYKKQQQNVTSFQDALPSQHTQSSSFYKKTTTSTSLSTVDTPLGVTSLSRMGTYEAINQKTGRVMEQSVMQLIASSYGLLDKEIDMLSEFSDEALQYAVTEKQRQKVSPTSVARWLASVASAFEKRKSSIPKTGRMGGFKQVSQFIPNQYPSYIPDKRLNMTNAERISYLTGEISNLKDIVAHPERYFIKKVNMPEVVHNFENILRNYEQHLADLINPNVKMVEKSQDEMTPEEWLLWNKDRKMKRLKEFREI